MSIRTSLYYRRGSGGKVAIEDMSISTGQRWFVHAGTGTDGTAYGFTPDKPFATIDYAIGKCTASKGDLIIAMEGHTETIAVAGGIACDVIGVKILGLGSGNLRPKISYSTADTASLTVTVANVTIENVIFDMTGFDGINSPISVSGAGFTLRGCEIEFADGTGQADCAILTTAAANDLTVEDCYFFGSGDAGTVTAIDLVGGDSARIRNNIIVGAFTNTVGGIRNATTAATNLLIENNIIDNRTAGSSKAVIVDAGTTGVIRGNSLSILSGIVPITAAAMVWGGSNTFTNAVATEGAGLTTTDSALNYIGVDDADNAVSTSSVVSNADGSVLEREEWLQAAVGTLANAGGTATLGGILGDVSNVSVATSLAKIGTLTNSGGTATLGGILGDVSNVSVATNLAKIGTIVNAGGTATIGGILGDFASSALVTRLNLLQAQTPATYVPGLGFRVTKTEDITDNTTTDDLFTVTGKVLITLWTGEVSVAAVGADLTDYLLRTKTDNVALCLATDIHGAAAGYMWTMSNDPGNTLLGSGALASTKVADTNGIPSGGLVLGLAGGTGLILQSLHADPNASTANMIHTLFYLPLEAGATVAAA